MSDLEDLRSGRLHPISGHSDGDDRTAFQHDRDRILYCTAFRRLSGITQVVSPSGSHPTHNRLTHSLEVAQIARSIASRLLRTHASEEFERVGGLNIDVVEAAALAHDLGHPPFGHVAEITLNQLLDKSVFRGGFEGNAQSFRIVNRLSTRYPTIEGLNLTRATLSAMTKYPWRRENQGPKSARWGAYDTEADELEWSRSHLNSVVKHEQTIEARIMDQSDDFAYAVHDLEDFYRTGLVPLERLYEIEVERQSFLEGHQTRHPNEDINSRRDVLGDLVEFFPDGPYDGKKKSKARLRSLTSSLINRFITAVEFDPESGSLSTPPEIAIQVELLKSMTWHYVIDSRALVTTRFGYASVISSLYRMLTEAVESARSGNKHNLGIFPEFFVEHLESVSFDLESIPRIVADTIASLTEAQTINLHQRLTGQSLGAVLDPIL